MSGKHVYHGGIFNYFNGANINKIVFNGGQGTEDNDDDAWTTEQTEVEQPQEERAEEKCELEEEPQPAQQAEEVEELCHFVHPSVDSQQEWDIHREIKRLVSRQGIQEICQYLLQMRKEHKVLLPQVADKAYDELVRMGMPNDEGYSLKTFMKYYKR